MSSYLKGLANKINGLDEKEVFTEELDINSLVPSSKNFYGIREIEELAASIEENGLMHNLVVRKKEDMYEILSGERRYNALKKLNWSKAPCKVIEASDLESEIILIQANVEQRELLPTEKMEGIKRLKAIYEQKKSNGEQLPKGKTRDLIGKDLGLSGSQVAKYQQVDNNLIGGLKKKLDEGDITLTQATTLSSLNTIEQADIYDQIKGMNKDSLKEEVNILVEGIKQPVSREEDEKLLNEMYIGKEIVMDIPEIKRGIHLDKQLEMLLEYDPSPRIILGVMGVEGILKARSIKIEGDNLNICFKVIISLAGSDSFIQMSLSELERIDSDMLPLGLKPKKVYRIHTGVYLWFKNK